MPHHSSTRPQPAAARLFALAVLSAGMTCATAATPTPGVAAPPGPRSAAAVLDLTGVCAGREQTLSSTRAIVAKPLPHDARLVVFPFDRNALYPVNAYFNRYTHFEFEAGEKVVGAYINDETEWEMRVAATGTDIMVRPRLRGVSGSLTVITERRRYQIDLLDVAACPGEVRYQRVSWVYQEGVWEDRAAAERMQAERRATPPAIEPGAVPAPASELDLTKLNFGYEIDGDKDISPVAVFDDGIRTVLKFAAASDLRPVLLAVGVDGKAEVAEYVPKGTTFIASRLFTHGILLKLGKQEVRIRNKSSSCGWFDSACRKVTATNVGGGQP